MNKIYLVEELFEDIPGDPDNVLFTIPPEVCEKAGFVPGDTLHIEVIDGQLMIKKI